jgi:hypothetical protein
MAAFTPQDSLYRIAEKLRTYRLWFFVALFVLSIIPAALKAVNLDFKVDGPVNLLSVISLIVFFIVDSLADYIIVITADNRRRDDLIDNGYGTRFSPVPSKGYYDNDDLDYGSFKAAANVYENTFFTTRILQSLTISKIILPVVLTVCCLVFAYKGIRDSVVIVPLVQTLFSGLILLDLVKHLTLIIRLPAIENQWIALFSRPDFKTNPESYKAEVIRIWMAYEGLTSRIPPAIPQKRKNEMNDTLTKEWGGVRTRYNIK